MTARTIARQYIEDMLDACNFIEQFTAGISEEDFAAIS